MTIKLERTPYRCGRMADAAADWLNGINEQRKEAQEAAREREERSLDSAFDKTSKSGNTDENGSQEKTILRQFRKIVLRCPAIDMYDVLTNAIMKNDEYERIVKGKDVQVGFDRKIIVTKDLLDALQENDIRKRDYIEYADDILIIHGTKDEVVPLEDSRLFSENNLIDFISVQGADHRFMNPSYMSLANKYAMEFFGMD